MFFTEKSDVKMRANVSKSHKETQNLKLEKKVAYSYGSELLGWSAIKFHLNLAVAEEF